MSEWLPIETAPKDGRSILVHRNLESGSPGGIAQDCWPGNTAIVEYVQDIQDGGKEYWMCYLWQLEDKRLWFDPTHWMPLPKPPRN